MQFKQPLNMQLNGLYHTITSSSSTPSLPYAAFATSEKRCLQAKGIVAPQISRSFLTLVEHTLLPSAADDMVVAEKCENGIISMNIDHRMSSAMDDAENDGMNALQLCEEKRLEEKCERYDDDYGFIDECSTMTPADDDNASDAPSSPTRLNPIGLKKRRPPAVGFYVCVTNTKMLQYKLYFCNDFLRFLSGTDNLTRTLYNFCN